ncbi:MAG: PD-(D/E)XK nuclease family protein [Nitriliruptorales bacterium]|nr:PD-(D/E)XK nuclease family protein [Nitriliruptorales bacterium]
MTDSSVDTGPQARVRAELLAWTSPRPVVDHGLADRLRGALQAGLAGVPVPEGQQLFLGKTALAALVCDGRFLDLEEQPFAWTTPMLRGTVAHKAIETDWRTARSQPAATCVEWAWEELAQVNGSLADALNDLDETGRRVLRGEAEQHVLDMRAAWPVLPPGVEVRFEPTLRHTSGDGRVAIQGRPDLVLGRIDPEHARMLVLDFKTGVPRPDAELQEARLYALLTTLRYGVPPFRWGVYNVPENSWVTEDLSEEALRSAVRRVIDGAVRAAELTFGTVREQDLRLVAGAWCNWCGREPFCEAARERRQDG